MQQSKRLTIVIFDSDLAEIESLTALAEMGKIKLPDSFYSEEEISHNFGKKLTTGRMIRCLLRLGIQHVKRQNSID